MPARLRGGALRDHAAKAGFSRSASESAARTAQRRGSGKPMAKNIIKVFGLDPFVPLVGVAALTYAFPVLTSLWVLGFWVLLLRCALGACGALTVLTSHRGRGRVCTGTRANERVCTSCPPKKKKTLILYETKVQEANVHDDEKQDD